MVAAMMATDWLPDPDARWTPLRKQAVVEAIRIGLLTEAGALFHYGLTAEELAQWQSGVLSYGTAAYRRRVARR
jgi:hypothetical protein